MKASIVILRMKEMWTPRPRCTPEQERHMKMPSLGEAYYRSSVFERARGRVDGGGGVRATVAYPLRTRRIAVDTFIVVVGLLDF